MNDRQKAIEDLKKQIKDGRDRLGPEGIKELQKLANSIQKKTEKPAAPTAKPVPEGFVPYDKESALKAFELFLKNHGDPKEFEKRLLALLKKSAH